MTSRNHLLPFFSYPSSLFICAYLCSSVVPSLLLCDLRVLCGQSQQRSIFTGDDQLGQPHAGFDLGRLARRREGRLHGLAKLT